MAGPDLIYKVADRSLVESAQASGIFRGAPIDLADGFIHFSTAAQLRDTLRLHFAGQGDLMLLAIRVSALDDLRWEPSRGGQLFPHLYGRLDPSEAASVRPLPLGSDGLHVFPQLS